MQANDDASAVAKVCMSCIFCNVALLIMDGENIPSTLATIIEVGGNIFTYLFIAEAVFKIVVLGLVDYFGNLSNLFDFFIIMASVAELTLTALGGMSALR